MTWESKTHINQIATLSIFPSGHIVAEASNLDLTNVSGRLLSMSLTGDLGSDQLDVTVPDLSRAVFIPRRRSHAEIQRGELVPLPCVYGVDVPNADTTCRWSGAGPDLRRVCDLDTICTTSRNLSTFGNITCGESRTWHGSGGCEKHVEGVNLHASQLPETLSVTLASQYPRIASTPVLIANGTLRDQFFYTRSVQVAFCHGTVK